MTVPLARLTVYAIGAFAVTSAWTMADVLTPASQAPLPVVYGAAIAGQFRTLIRAVASAIRTEPDRPPGAARQVGAIVLGMDCAVRNPRAGAIIGLAELRVPSCRRHPSPLVAIACVSRDPLGVRDAARSAELGDFTTEGDRATALGRSTRRSR